MDTTANYEALRDHILHPPKRKPKRSRGGAPTHRTREGVCHGCGTHYFYMGKNPPGCHSCRWRQCLSDITVPAGE
jgi:hypothetical protein